MNVKRVLKSPNTTLVVSGIMGTLATIHPGYAGIIAVLMAALAPIMPGYVKPNPPSNEVK